MNIGSKKMSPKISVIVPIYNVEKCVVGCLTALQNQTYRDFEVICLDDGSTDNSRQCVQDFITGDDRFILLHHKNCGLAATRNRGLEQARGEYIYFCDSDDYLHPQALEMLVRALETTGADVAGCIRKKTNQTYPAPFPVFETNILPEIILDPFHAFLERDDIVSGVCTRLYRRSAIGETRFIPGIFFEDVPFTTHILSSIHMLAQVKYELYYYYLSPSSIVRSSFDNRKIDSYLTVIQAVYDDIRQHRPSDLAAVRRAILNKRVKMVMNAAVRKQKNKRLRRALFRHMEPAFRDLFARGIISYDGLKFKHKVCLWLILHGHGATAARILPLCP